MRATVDGNEAAASVAYRCSEVCCIYPITPSSPMAELADEWSSQGRPTSGARCPRWWRCRARAARRVRCTARCRAARWRRRSPPPRACCLMIPNMYKIAGELTSAVLHVAARSLAAQGLSIFGDHSDVMAVRQTGFALLASASVQEAHDLALVAQAATLADPGAVRALLRRVSHLARAEHDRDARPTRTCGRWSPEELVRAHRGAGAVARSGRSSAAPRRTRTSTSRRARPSTRSTPASPRWCRTRWTSSASAPAATTGWSTTAATPRPSGCSW